MTGHDGSMREVLNGYAKFLQEKNLALDKHQPYLVRWVAEFLRFARAHSGYSFEHTLDLRGERCQERMALPRPTYRRA